MKLDDPFLVRVVKLRDLANTLDLSVIEALALFGIIDTQDPKTSLYEQVFRNFAVVDPPPTIFDLNAQRTELAAAGQALTLSQYALSLLAPLGISASDFALLVPAAVSDLLTLANLSGLYRHTRLAQALNISVSDLLDLIALTGVDPFVIDSTQTLLDDKAAIDTSGFTIAELRFLLQQQDVVLSGLAPDATAASLLLVALRTALNALLQTTTPPSFDATNLPTLVSDALGRMLPAVQAAAALTIIDSGQPPSAADQAFIQQYFVPFWNPADAIAFLTSKFVVSDRQEEALSHLTADHYLDPLVVALKNDFGKVFKGDVVETAVAVTLGQRSSADTTQFIATQFPTFMDKKAVDAAQIALAVNDSQLPPNGQKLRARIDFILPYLAGYLFRTGAYALLQQQLGTALSLSSKSLRLLLDDVYLHPPQAPAKESLYTVFTSPAFLASTASDQTDKQFRVALYGYELLSKVAILVTRLNITADDIAALASLPATAHVLGLSELPLVPSTSTATFDHWRRLVVMLTLAKKEPGGRAALYALLTAPATSSNLPKLAVAVFACSRADLDAIVTQLFGPANYKSLLDVDSLMRVDGALRLMKRCNVPAATLIGSWIGAYVLSTDADALKQSVKARYDHDTWLSVAKPLQNQLRERQRDALRGVLDGIIPSTYGDDFWSDYLLIDIETSSAVQASRIQNATLTIQRYVQRSFLNLEPFQLSADQTTQWSWMSQYPLWRANREVFLYPENWIAPTLRSDKTELFAALESAVAQQDLTSDVADDALFDYIAGVTELSNLVIINGTDIYKTLSDIERHVVARTPFKPYKFYHRYQSPAAGSTVWSPWKRINIDIQSDDVLVAYVNQRLYMLWPTFSGETPDTQTIRGPGTTMLRN